MFDSLLKYSQQKLIYDDYNSNHCSSDDTKLTLSYNILTNSAVLDTRFLHIVNVYITVALQQ